MSTELNGKEEENQDNIYKLRKAEKNNIYPGDPKGLPDDTLVFLDSGFLSRVSKHFGRGKHISYDLIRFSLHLAKRESLLCKRIFYFTAPPFQGSPATEEENKRRRKHDKFISKIKENNLINVEEGRVQRIKDRSGDYNFKQKGVDALLIMRLCFVPLDFPDIKKIILVSSDTDFCPVISELQSKYIEVILYSYHEKKRNTSFSVSTELIKCCSKYVKLAKEDFEESAFSNEVQNK